MTNGQILPIVAAVEEAEAIADIATEAIVFELLDTVGAGPLPIGDGLGGCGVLLSNETSSIDRAIAAAIERTCRGLVALIGDANLAVGDLLAGASQGLNSVLDAVEGQANNILSKVTGAIESIIDVVASRLEDTIRTISDRLEQTVETVGRFLADVVRTIESAVDSVLNNIGFAVSGLINSIGQGFNEVLRAAGSLLNRIDSTVSQVGEFLAGLAEATLEAMATTIAATLGPIVGAADSVLARLGDLVESVPGAVTDAAEALAAGIGTLVGAPLLGMGSILVTQIEAFFGAMIEEGNLSQGEVLRSLLTSLGVPGDVANTVATAADDAAPETPALFVAALAFLVPLVIAQFLGSALEPLAQQMGQEIAGSTRQTLIPPADLLDGFFKGTLPGAVLQEDFKQAGYSQERMDLLVASFRHAPDVGVSVEAWLRDLIDENELDQTLHENRIRPDDARLLKQVVFSVPPAQDLIRMAVREVFSPEIRERFGQDEGFPTEFATFAKQQGISDEWARAYWAAHWLLPSPQQGFEMLHRRVIEPADLDSLLKALDVMPFWREKLTQIAFSPLTRVDVRRMHALGLLTDDDLKRRYEDLGFNSDDADMMVAFTVVFNAVDEELPDELEGLTRSTVLNMFDDGILDRDVAVSMLLGMGIGTEAAQLYVDQRELETSRRDRRALIEGIVALAGGGHISLPEAQDSLADLGITAIEGTRALGRILSKRDSRDRVPALGQLKQMREAGVIDNAVFAAALGASGFNDVWVGRMFKLETGEELE